MAIDFPASPTDGQVFTPTGMRSFVYSAADGAWQKRAGTALPTNKLVNASMQISEQNGSTSTSTTAANAGYYTADQWLSRWSFSGTGTMYAYRSALQTPPGSMMTALSGSAAQASLGASDYAILEQYIEGNRIADLNWGTANAQAIVLKFWAMGPAAGTYSVRLANGPTANRTYIATYTLPAYTWAEVVLPIPGDTTGTWATDNTLGLRISFVHSMGSTFLGVPGWQAGNFYTVPGQLNLMASAGSTLYIASVGIYADPYNTGVPPVWVSNHYEDDLQDCMRYFQKCYRLNGVVYTATQMLLYAQNYVTMRVIPTASIVGTPRLYDGLVAPNATSTSNYQHLADSTSQVVVSSGLTGGRFASMLVDAQTANYMALNARM